MRSGKQSYFRIFLMFFLRDWQVYKKRFWGYLIDYALIETSINIFSFGYLLPNANSSTVSSYESTLMFLGGIMWTIFPLTYSVMIDLWFDFEGNKFLAYQLMFAPAWIVLVQRVLFLTVYCYTMVLLYIPLAKLILGNLLLLNNASWLSIYGMLFVSVLLGVLFNLFNACYFADTDKIANMWLRIFNPLMNLGGAVVPLAFMRAYSPWLGTFVLLNPLLYVTEGFKYSVLGDSMFIAACWCVLVLLLFSGAFLCGSLFFLRRKIDHV